MSPLLLVHHVSGKGMEGKSSNSCSYFERNYNIVRKVGTGDKIDKKVKLSESNINAIQKEQFLGHTF